MENCGGCHSAEHPSTLARRFIRADLHFSHASHERDRVGRAIGCTACHDSMGNASTVFDIPPPQMQRCTLCHDDRRVTPPEVRMNRCAGCHLAASQGEMEGVLAPRTHQLGTIAPDDHTLVFRREHAAAARSAGARCAGCHQGLSGSRRDSCQECHAVMRPRDHNITWRQEDHGREAAAARERCASCHQADYCEACHSVPPRSHLPITDWLSRNGHGAVARLSLRSCFACHTFENTCGASGCHERGLR
jgi:hypothetical protein